MAADVESTNNVGVRFQSAIAVGSAAAATLLACNLLTGVGDLDTAECRSDCEAGVVPERTTLPDATLPVDDAAVTPDAPAPADGGIDASKRPTFCSGIELYLPFDGTLDARSGQPPDLPPTVAFVPGKFGQGADLTGVVGRLGREAGKITSRAKELAGSRGERAEAKRAHRAALTVERAEAARLAAKDRYIAIPESTEPRGN